MKETNIIRLVLCLFFVGGNLQVVLSTSVATQQIHCTYGCGETDAPPDSGCVVTCKQYNQKELNITVLKNKNSIN